MFPRKLRSGTVAHAKLPERNEDCYQSTGPTPLDQCRRK